jgi:hypothetical protein
MIVCGGNSNEISGFITTGNINCSKTNMSERAQSYFLRTIDHCFPFEPDDGHIRPKHVVHTSSKGKRSIMRKK